MQGTFIKIILIAVVVLIFIAAGLKTFYPYPRAFHEIQGGNKNEGNFSHQRLNDGKNIVRDQPESTGYGLVNTSNSTAEGIITSKLQNPKVKQEVVGGSSNASGDIAQSSLHTASRDYDINVKAKETTVDSRSNTTGYSAVRIPHISSGRRYLDPGQHKTAWTLDKNSPFYISAGEPQRINTTFKILYWTGSSRGRHSSRNWFGLGHTLFEQCEYKNCLLTDNREEYNSSDAILMYLRYARPTPSYRFPWQKWIMRIHEPPANEGDYTEYNHMFNATWTYHTKSDVYSHWYYKQFIKNPTLGQSGQLRNYALGKKRAVAWFVSRCSVQSKRMLLVKELQKHVEVDVYGKCSGRPCGHRMSEECDQMLATDYKFYLSLENSICEQYVTEKLWRAYLAEVIPIVIGSSNYSGYLPEHSYIDVGDFGSVQELADYIKILDRNDTMYNEYFEWKRSYELSEYGWEGCPLCEYLNLSANVTQIYHKMNRFWNEKTDCTAPRVFYKDLFASIG